MPAIHAASHADHEKKVAWFSIATCMHACGSVLIIVMVLRLADFRAS